LTLLDSRGGSSGGGSGDFGADQGGGEFGSPGPSRKVAAPAGAGRGDMDDEIPF
jgi:single-strand DNA-binding protein